VSKRLDKLPHPVDSVTHLPRRRSLLLSASLPAPLDPKDFVYSDHREVRSINRTFVMTARPDRIRAAVIAITRVALKRDVRLVFGAHPSISPLVLQVAQDLHARADDILVFQSAAYAGEIPGSTLDLADWSCGELILTSEQHEPTLLTARSKLKRLNRYQQSLAFMRRLMADVPGLVGAAFVGGMRGVEKEAGVVANSHPNLNRYAFESTGGAAARLGQGFSGTLAHPDVFRVTPSYTVAASMMLDDLPP